MNRIIFTLAHLFIFGALYPSIGLSDSPATNNLSAKIARARSSTDYGAIVNALPEIEKLWPATPDLYFQNMREALAALHGESATNAPVISMIFTNILQKQCSTNVERAISCFENKWRTAMEFGPLTGHVNQEEELTALAYFLGEVRSQSIPNYKNRGSLNPPGLQTILSQAGTFNPNTITNTELKRAYQKLVKENQENIKMDQLQSLLMRIDSIVAPRFLQTSAYFVSRGVASANFIQKVNSMAHLTDEERKKLEEMK